MKRSTYIRLVAICTLWGLLALAELSLAYILAENAVFYAHKLILTRWVVLKEGGLYFSGVAVGVLIQSAVACLMIWHAVWIFRKRLITGGNTAIRPKLPHRLG